MKYIVCIASEHKGNEFLEECQNAGWHVTLVTRKKLLDEPWLWTSLNAVKTVEDDATAEDYIRAITNIAGTQPITRVVGLDEFDVLTAAKARERLNWRATYDLNAGLAETIAWYRALLA